MVVRCCGTAPHVQETAEGKGGISERNDGLRSLCGVSAWARSNICVDRDTDFANTCTGRCLPKARCVDVADVSVWLCEVSRGGAGKEGARNLCSRQHFQTNKDDVVLLRLPSFMVRPAPRQATLSRDSRSIDLLSPVLRVLQCRLRCSSKLQHLWTFCKKMSPRPR